MKVSQQSNKIIILFFFIGLILTLDQTLLQLNESSGTASINIVPFNGTISELETPITLPYESQPSLIGNTIH